MHRNVYYAAFERDGWFEYHCSTNKLEVEKCQALSVRVKLASPHGIPSFVRVVLIQQLKERIRQEVQTNGMVRVMVDADENVSLEV